MPLLQVAFESFFHLLQFVITCQTPNYQILWIYDIYNLNISRFQPVDILVFIADTPTGKNRKAGPNDPALIR